MWTQEHFLLDDSYPHEHPYHIVVKAHCSRLQDGSVSASGLLDPKYIRVGNISHRQLEFANPRCELCESSDMIPLEERFYNSAYKPQTHPLPLWRLVLSKLKRRLNRIRDLREQRDIVKRTMPK